MKKIAFLALSVGCVVSGCGYQPGANWRENCEANASYDSYEYARCLDSVTTSHENEDSASPAPTPPVAVAVTIDPENANRPGREDLGKGNIE